LGRVEEAFPKDRESVKEREEGKEKRNEVGKGRTWPP